MKFAEEVWKPEESKVFQLPLRFGAPQRSCFTSPPPPAISQALRREPGTTGGCDFPFSFSQEKLEICPLLAACEFLQMED